MHVSPFRTLCFHQQRQFLFLRRPHFCSSALSPVRMSREEFLKINIGARRKEGPPQKYSISSVRHPFLFYLFSTSLYGFFCNANRVAGRSPALSSRDAPTGKRSGYSNQLDLRGREFTKEVSGCASARGQEARESLFSQKRSANLVQSLLRYRFNNFILECIFDRSKITRKYCSFSYYFSVQGAREKRTQI